MRARRLQGAETVAELHTVYAPPPVEGNLVSKQVYLQLLKENDRLKAQVSEKKKGSFGLRQKYKELKASTTEKYRFYKTGLHEKDV